MGPKGKRAQSHFLGTGLSSKLSINSARTLSILPNFRSSFFDMRARQQLNTPSTSETNFPMLSAPEHDSQKRRFSSSPEEIAETRLRDAIMQASLAWLNSPQFYQKIADRRRDQQIEAFIASVTYYYDLFHQVLLLFSFVCSMTTELSIFIGRWTVVAVHVILQLSALIHLVLAEFLSSFARLAAAVPWAIISIRLLFFSVAVFSAACVGTCYGAAMNKHLYGGCRIVLFFYVCSIAIVLAIRMIRDAALTVSIFLELIGAPLFQLTSACFDQLVIALLYSSQRCIDLTNKAASLPASIWVAIGIDAYDLVSGSPLYNPPSLFREDVHLWIWLCAYSVLLFASRYSASSNQINPDQMPCCFPLPTDSNVDTGAGVSEDAISIRVTPALSSASSSHVIMGSPVAVICPDTSKPTPAEPPPVEI